MHVSGQQGRLLTVSMMVLLKTIPVFCWSTSCFVRLGRRCSATSVILPRKARNTALDCGCNGPLPLWWM